MRPACRGVGPLISQIEDLSSADAVVRGRAIDSLAERGETGLVELVSPLLEDSDWVVSFKAAVALAWAGDDRGGPVLLSALAQPDLCFMALEALTHLGSQKALPGLQQFFARRVLHPLERVQAAAAIYRSGDDRGLDFLSQRFEQGLPEERGFAMELWGRLELPQAFQRLHKVLSDEDHPHRLDALRGLVALGDERNAALFSQVASQGRDEVLAAEARGALDHMEAGPE